MVELHSRSGCWGAWPGLNVTSLNTGEAGFAWKNGIATDVERAGEKGVDLMLVANRLVTSLCPV